MSSLASECRLLLEAAAVAAPATGVVAPEARATLSWERVLERAIPQRCAPLLCRWIHSAGDRVPQSAAQALDRLYMQNVLRTEGIRQQLAGVAGALAAAGIPVMALKGVYLAHTVYPDPALRPMVDIDLMVPPASVRRLPELLEPLGYRLEAGTSHSRWDALWRESEVCRFSAPGRRSLEIHTALGGRAWPAAAVWQRAQSWALAGVDLCAPDPNDLLLHLLQHIVHHLDGPRPVYLIWLSDVARVLVHFSDRLDPDALAAACRRLKIEGYAHLVLQFACELLGAPAPGFPTNDERPTTNDRRLTLDARRSADGRTRWVAAGTYSLGQFASSAPRAAFTLERLAGLATAAADEVAQWQMEPTAAARSRWRRRGLVANAAYVAGLLAPSADYLARHARGTSRMRALTRHYGRLLPSACRHAMWPLRLVGGRGGGVVRWWGGEGPTNDERPTTNDCGLLRHHPTTPPLPIAGVFARCRATGESVRLPAQGTSMFPAIRPGDTLVVQPVDPAGIGFGEILVWADGERLIAHRVVRVCARMGRPWFQTHGDARPKPDPLVPAERALGRVVAVERPGSEGKMLRLPRAAGLARASILRGRTLAAATLRRARKATAGLRAPASVRKSIGAR